MNNVTNRDVAIGVFHHREKAEAAIADLRSAGFATEDIGVVSRNEEGLWSDYDRTPEPVEDNTATTGAAMGAAAGAGVGGLWALGIAAGMLQGLRIKILPEMPVAW